MTTLVFVERLVRMDYDYGFETVLETNVYEVSVEAWEAFKAENDFEASYVNGIVEAALEADHSHVATELAPRSEKYSFSDTPDWFKPLQPKGPDADTRCFAYDVYKR